MRLAAMNLLVGPAEGAQALEGLYQPEGKAGLLAPGALADDTVHTALGQRPGSLTYDRFAHRCL